MRPQRRALRRPPGAPLGAPTGPLALTRCASTSVAPLRLPFPTAVELGHRCIAPDLIGFGRSDKPVRQGDYSYAAHVRWATKFFTALGLDRVTLVCQDWGGLVGLRLVAAMPDRFARVVAANTGLPTGDMPMPKAFKEWQAYSRRANPFNVGPIISRAVAKPMSPAVLAAYDAPFPDESFKAGAKIFPSLVPSTPDDPEAPAQRAAWEVLQRYSRPFLTAFSDKDPVTRGGDLLFQGMVPGAEGQAHKTLKGGGHFLQEDVGVELADVVHAFIVDTADAHTRPALKSSL